MSMERNTPVDLSRSAESFIRAFECILDTMAEENRTGSIEQRKLSAEQLKSIQSLHSLLSVGGLKPEPHASETLSYCDGFISEWESTRVKSAAVQQLISLLNRPHVRGVLVSVEDISACRYHPQLPPVPFEVDEDEGIAVKIVRIVKRDEPLGATIKSDRGRIYIARIIAGGVADRSACIQEGDRVLEVNGLSVADLKVDDVARLLNRSENGSVTFKLVPVEVPHGTSDRSHIHLRAQFDYDGSKDLRHPCPEAALSFKKGDILELLVCNDEHWWQARRLGYGALANIDDGRCSPHGDSNTLRVGLIPSEMLQLKTRIVEKEEKQSMGKGSVLSRNSCEEDLIYESVCRLYPRPRLVRPVVLIGPPGVGRNELKRRLLMIFPERFSTTIPHTSRSPRAGEIDGVDYYFVSRIEMENMIHKGHMLEFGEYRGNLYGTTLSAVRIARESAIPLLTPHPLALRQLRTSEFSPIIIFIQPPDTKTFKETRAAFRARMSCGVSAASGASVSPRGFTDLEIEHIVNAGLQLDKQYGHLFDARIINGSLEDTMSRIIKLLNALESRPTWAPLSWATKMGEA